MAITRIIAINDLAFHFRKPISYEEIPINEVSFANIKSRLDLWFRNGKWFPDIMVS